MIHCEVWILSLQLQVNKTVLVSNRSYFEAKNKAWKDAVLETEGDTTTEAQYLTASLGWTISLDIFILGSICEIICCFSIDITADHLTGIRIVSLYSRQLE